MQEFEPVPDNPKVAGIVDRLVTAIAAGDFLPGSRLPSERALAATLSVGRNTVRSALLELSDRGLIETRRGRSGGAFVLTITPSAARESVQRVFGTDLEALKSATDALGLGNALVAETAAMRRSDEDLAVIEACLSAFREAVAADDPSWAQRADAEFHQAIVASTRQPELGQLIQSLDLKFSLGSPHNIWGAPHQQIPMQRKALGEHELIFAAVRDRDRSLAFDLAYRHVYINLDLVLGLLEE